MKDFNQCSFIESTEDQFTETPENVHFIKKLKENLDILRGACRKQPKCLAFMYAELNDFVSRLPHNSMALQIIGDSSTDILATMFLPVFDLQKQRNGGYKVNVSTGYVIFFYLDTSVGSCHEWSLSY